VVLVLRWIPLALFLVVSAYLATLKPPPGKPATAATPGSPAPVASAVAPVGSAGTSVAPVRKTKSAFTLIFGASAGAVLLGLMLGRIGLRGYVTRRTGRADFFEDRLVIY